MDQGNHAAEISYATLYPVTDEDLSQQLDHRACPRRGCKRAAHEDSDYCLKHERDLRRYNREYDRRRRAEWAEAKRCMRCGAQRRKAGSNWCPACVIRLQTMRKKDLKSQLDHNVGRSARIAKRLVPWTNSPHNEGRLRLRGGDRGAPSLEARDRRDLADIQKILVRYEAALGEAYSVEVGELSREQQVSARAAAHAGLALAVRLGMEALVRHGYEAPVLAEDDDPEDDE